MSVTINGITYEGENITVINNRVYVDGEEANVTPDKQGVLHVRVTGNLHNLDADGSVTCEDVTGDVDAGGSVNCKNVGGDIDAGGSVNCGTVGGDIEAGGSVRHG